MRQLLAYHLRRLLAALKLAKDALDGVCKLLEVVVALVDPDEDDDEEEE